MISLCIAFMDHLLRDEFRGQPVEQFRMRRISGTRAEIARRFHEARAEVELPDPIRP